jgi:hypothetical protein
VLYSSTHSWTRYFQSIKAGFKQKILEHWDSHYKNTCNIHKLFPYMAEIYNLRPCLNIFSQNRVRCSGSWTCALLCHNPHHSDYFAWRQATQRSLLFHFAGSLEPRCFMHCTAVTMKLLQHLKQTLEMVSFGTQTHTSHVNTFTRSRGSANRADRMWPAAVEVRAFLTRNFTAISGSYNRSGHSNYVDPPVL